MGLEGRRHVQLLCLLLGGIFGSVARRDSGSRGDTEPCYCWSPERVTVTQEHTTVRVTWHPFYSLKDLLVGIFDSQHQQCFRKVITRKHLQTTSTKELHVEWNYSSESIKAMVGAVCKRCRRRYKTSPALLLHTDSPNKTVPVILTPNQTGEFILTSQAPDSGSNLRRGVQAPPSQHTVALVVCVLLMVLAAGVRCWRSFEETPKRKKTLASLHNSTLDSLNDYHFIPPDLETSSDVDSVFLEEQLRDINLT